MQSGKNNNLKVMHIVLIRGYNWKKIIEVALKTISDSLSGTIFLANATTFWDGGSRLQL